LKFHVFQSLWAMGRLPFGSNQEWSLAERFEKLVEGGFDGIDIPWTPVLESAEAVEHALGIGLPYGLTCFPTSVEALEELVGIFGVFDPGPLYLNIQPARRAFAVDEGAFYLREWIRVGEAAGFRVLIETHRDRMTTDLRFTLQLLDEVPEMRLVADLSHFLVGQEFAWPVRDEDHDLIRRVLQRSDMFHGRVASREQVQIAITWEHHRQWLDLFLGWWEEGFRLWRERAAPDHDLIFVTELGPPDWYAITGPDGAELSDRWAESLLLKRYASGLWQRLEATTGGRSVRTEGPD
jgi:hypothetical protein